MRCANALSRVGRWVRRSKDWSPSGVTLPGWSWLTICLVAAFATFAAAADPAPMSPDDFSSYVTGKTLFYEIGGTAYGAEHYMIGHRVVWAYLGQPCRRGHWFPASDGRICFLYEDNADAPDCWHFYREPAGLRAQFLGSEIGKEGATQQSSLQVVEVRSSPKPLRCPGSAAGV